MRLLPWWVWAIAGAGGIQLAWGAISVRDERLREEGRAEVREQAREAAEAQATRNRELQRAAEKRYTVARQGQDRYFVTTVKEIRDAAAPLAVCPVPDAVRLRLNAAASCARGDSPSACGAADEVPDAQ